LCRKGCLRKYTAVAVHYDCFTIFTHTCALGTAEALSCLWTLGAWRSPWLWAQPLQLQPNYDMPRDVLERVASITGHPQLGRCPTELLYMIRGYDPQCLFWRAVSTMALAASCSYLPDPSKPLQTLVTLPLAEIADWERGGPLPRLHDAASLDVPTPLGTMLITIDAAGIKTVQRLSARAPPFSEPNTDSLAFILADVSSLGGVGACFNGGLLRLHSLLVDWSVQIWDTPSPPSLPSSSCALLRNSGEPVHLVRTVKLGTVTGLTFFYDTEYLLDIHPHYAKSPSAVPFDEHLSQRWLSERIWVYLPISREDSVDVLGFRTSTQRSLAPVNNVLVS
jgi:hypothetical protein